MRGRSHSSSQIGRCQADESRPSVPGTALATPTVTRCVAKLGINAIGRPILGHIALPSDTFLLMSTFRVSALPDGGDFGQGANAPLAFDILKRTATHAVPDVIDLSACTHLKPYAISCLCGLGILARSRGKDVSLILPENGGCKEHLCRLDLPRWFTCGPIPSVVQRTSNLPIEHVTWPPGQAAERIIDMIAPQAQLGAGVSPRMKESLDEIITNALTHAESPIECVVAGQAFPATGKVEVSVLDLGQTVRGHLSKHPKYLRVASDQEAILLAVQDGVTGTPPGTINRRGIANSGAGLAFVREYCSIGGGQMTILSGDVWVTFGESAEPVIGHLRQRFQGCLVNVRFFTGIDLPSAATEPIL
jgi:hypothetical protein